jgi:hypothetical protein
MMMFRVVLFDSTVDRSVTIKGEFISEEDALAYMDTLPDPKDELQHYETEEYNEIG